MNSELHDDERDPLELLAEQYLAQRRSGEVTQVEAFAAEHPAYAEAILALFPTMLRLEQTRSAEPAHSSNRLGRWTIVRELGRGGMGVVYLAVDPATGARAALKLLSNSSPPAVARFRREAQAVAHVVHPGLCRVVEVGPAGEGAWIALEHVEGETLADALRHERRRVAEGGARTVGLARWLDVGEQAARALHAAHEAGLVHRDVKPANLMLTPEGRAVILDFGLAHGAEEPEATRITRTGAPVGTPAYMSPEQVRADSGPLDGRTDVYSLGATLYEAFTLEAPFAGPTVAALFSQILASDPLPARRRNPALPRDLEVVLATALEKRPERRYATALALAEDLGRVRRGERVQARPPGTARRLGRWAVRNPRVAVAVGSSVLALCVGLIVALVLLARVADARDRAAASARHARGRALASASAEALHQDAMLALLLAREGVRAERTPETVTQLHAAVHGSLERVRLAGHGAAVRSISWDGRGAALATGCSDGRARVYGADGTLRLVVPGDGVAAAGPVLVALAPTATSLATLEADGTVRLWGADGTERSRLAEAATPASHLLYLADDTVVVVGAQGRIALHRPDGTLRTAWQVALEGEGRSPVFVGATASASPLRLHVFTREGRGFTYDEQGNEAFRRDEAVGAPHARMFERGRIAFATARGEAPLAPDASGSDLLRVLAADGTALGTLPIRFGAGAALCGGDAWWCVWEQSSGATLVDLSGAAPRPRVLDMQRSERPALLRASADGGRLLTCRELRDMRFAAGAVTDATRLWNPQGVPLGTLTSVDNLIESAEFSPDGQLVALGPHIGGVVTVHGTAFEELATFVPRWRTSEGYRYPVALTSDGRHMVAFADERHLLILRDDGTERARVSLEGPGEDGARHLSVLGGGDLLLVTGREGTVSVRDLDGLLRFRLPATPAVERAAWLGTAGAFVTVVKGPRVRIHGKDGTVLKEIEAGLLWPDPRRGFADEAALVVGAERVLVVGSDGGVRRTIEVPRAMGYQGSAAGPAVLVEGGEHVKGTELGTCHYVDAQGVSLWQVPLGGMGKRTAAISADGERVAVVASGGLSLRDRAGREVAHLRLEAGATDLTFDGRGLRLAAAGLDGTVRVWDREGRPLFSLPAQGGPCNLGFSDDGRRLATVTAAMVRLFTTDTDELVGLAERRSTRDFTPAERARFAEMFEAPR